MKGDGEGINNLTNGIGIIINYFGKNSINLETYRIPKYIHDGLKDLSIKLQDYIFLFFSDIGIKFPSKM